MIDRSGTTLNHRIAIRSLLVAPQNAAHPTTRDCPRDHEGARNGEGPSRRTLSTIYPSDQHTLRTPYVVNIPTVRPDTLQQTVEYARTTREDSTSGALMIPEVWNQGRFDSEKMETVSNGTVVDDVKREHGKLIGIIYDYVDDVMADNDDNDNDTQRSPTSVK